MAACFEEHNGPAFFKSVVRPPPSSIRDISKIINLFKQHMIQHRALKCPIMTISVREWPGILKLNKAEMKVLEAAIGTDVVFRVERAQWVDKTVRYCDLDTNLYYFYDVLMSATS